MDDRLDQLVSTIQTSRKYRAICEPVIRRIGHQELEQQRTLKDAIKATRNRLHQIGGAYLDTTMRYDEWGDALQQTQPDQLQNRCREIMRHHASTRERTSILDEFYATLFEQIGPVKSVLDVACGLNPLAIPWMALHPGARYHAYDIYTDMMAFIGRFLKLAGIQGEGQAQDVIQVSAFPKVELALILKTLPCLEQIEKTAAARLLAAIDARYYVVSYPVRSLGGRHKGMVEHYEAQLQTLVAGKPWHIWRFEFRTELAFILTPANY